MTLAKYNFDEYRPLSFRNFMDRLFNDELVGTSASTFSPVVDIIESENGYELELHTPGMKKEEIKIDLDEKQITISGERQLNSENNSKNYRSLESRYGTFSRTFALPDVIDKEKAEASYQDGILKIRLPKNEKKVTKTQLKIK